MAKHPKQSDQSRTDLEQRLKREERRNPSGHGQQTTPHQQRETTESAEHDDDRARAVIDPKRLQQLKD